MYQLVQLFRLPIYSGRIPTLAELLPALIISLVTLVIGWWVFTSKSDEFAYRI
jgi:ABC-type polysaccharide/polyol phosphate export permease